MKSMASGQGESFARGRDLAAWLGLVPRQLTTGGRPRLVGISKRGNKYFRKLLIHGARAALPTLLESPTSLGAWLRGLMTRMHKNAVVVALANKLARLAWAVLRHCDVLQTSEARRTSRKPSSKSGSSKNTACPSRNVIAPLHTARQTLPSNPIRRLV